MCMHQPLMFFDQLGCDMPAAVAAGKGLVVAAVTIVRPAIEELLQPSSILRIQVAGITGQGQFVAAAVAAPGIEPS